MMDVLPTLWSPRNTSLYFASGARDVVDRAFRVDDVRDDTDAEEDGIEEDVVVALAVSLIILTEI